VIRIVLCILVSFLSLTFGFETCARTPFSDFVLLNWKVDVDADGKVVLIPHVKILDKTAASTTVRVLIENNYNAWYEVFTYPLGPLITNSSIPASFILPPRSIRDLNIVTFGANESLSFVADGTSSNVMKLLAAEVIWRLISGSSLPTNAIDVVLQALGTISPFASFITDLSLALQKGVVGIPEALLILSTLPTIPEVLDLLKVIATINNNRRVAKIIEKIGGNTLLWFKIMLRAGKIIELELQTLFSPHVDVLEFSAALIRQRPQPPTSLRTVPISSNSIELRWQDKSNNEDGFKIYRNGDFITQVGKDQTIYTDTNIQPNTRYCYQVSAFNSVGESSLSNRACARTLSAPNRPPIANAGPDQTVQVGSTVQLDGRDSTDPDGDPIKSYRWKILPRENSARCVFKSSSNIAQPTIQPRQEGSCTIELVVSDGKLNSAPDQVTITAKTDITPPVLIQNFLASDNEDGRSTLTWTNPSDSDLSQVIVKRKTTGYPVNHEDGETRLTIDSATPGRAETFVDTGLTNGTIYYYAVFSRDKVGNWNDQVVEGKNADTGRPQVLPPPPPPPPPSATAPWPMFQHDAQRSGRSPYVGPQGPNVKWTFQDSSIPFWEPVVAADGTIYVGGGYTGDIGGFYAINPDGSLKWVNNSIRVFEGPVLGPEGQIYVIAYAYPDNNPFLLALNPDGTERWRYEWFSVDYYDAELVIDENGNIYHLTGCYSQSDQRVHPSLLAFNPQGSIIWLYDITDRQTYPNGVCVVSGLTLGGSASSALDKEGNIYAMVSFPPELDGTILFALRPDGTEKWRRTFDGWAAGISIDQDGTIYASVGGYGKIYAIDPSSPNHDKWVVYVQGLGSAVTIGTEDIYVTGGSAPDGTWRSYLYAFDKQGNAKWQKFIGYEATSVPILGGDGTIYIGARQWRVYAFRPDGSEKWSSSECAVFGDDAVSAGGSLAIAADGTLYTAGPQKLCAFGESVAGSISAPGEVLAVQAYPGSVRFLAAEAMALRVEVFNLAGRRIYDSGLVSGNSLYWDGLMSDGRRLANGVYLYVVTIRKQDGTILRSQVKKLVILR